MWLIKTDGAGNRVWDKAFGGSNEDDGSSVRQTSDSGYIVVGSTLSSGAGDYDVWLIKTDGAGDKVWDRTFGGTAYDDGNSVKQTSDGGYVITGFTYSYGAAGGDLWLIKTDANGNRVWDKTFDGLGEDVGSSVQQTSDGGYIIAGYTISYAAGSHDAWLIKTDANGNKVWDRTFSGEGVAAGYSVQQTLDGGYVLTGYTGSYGGGNGGVWLLKTDADGN